MLHNFLPKTVAIAMLRSFSSYARTKHLVSSKQTITYVQNPISVMSRPSKPTFVKLETTGKRERLHKGWAARQVHARELSALPLDVRDSSGSLSALL